MPAILWTETDESLNGNGHGVEFLHIALPVFLAVFALVEAAQYLRGGRAASSQDVVLGAAGATLAASYFGALLQPLTGEMLRELRNPRSAVVPRLGAVSPRRTVVAAAALLGPFVWVAMLAPPTPSASAGPLPGRASTCGLPDGEWAIPDAAPTSEWFQWHGNRVPRSRSGAGPVHVGSQGARCFMRTPSGALLAASWDEDLLRHSRLRPLIGFRIDQANPDTVLLRLALAPVGHQYLVAHARVHWADGDWQTALSWTTMSISSQGPPAGFTAWGRQGDHS